MKETRTMWEILEDSKDLENQLIEAEGELTPELEELININQNELLDKIERYYYVIQNLTNKAELEKQQKERFEKREKTLKNSAQRLKDAIDVAVGTYGITDIKSKAKIPSKKLEAGTVKATGVAYPVVDPTTLPEDITVIDEKYLDYTGLLKISKKDAELLTKAIETYNEKVGSKTGELALIPELKPEINLNILKSDLKDGIEVEGIKLTPNYKTKFS
jgi:hypothetical protein